MNPALLLADVVVSDEPFAPGSSAPQLTTRASSIPAARHVWARGIIVPEYRARHGVDPHPFIAQIIGGVACLETGYGLWSFKGPNGEKIPNLHNWGAIQATGNQPAGEVATDTYPDGRPYTQRFRVYASDAEGCADLIRHMSAPMRPMTQAALRDGSSITAVSRAMRAEHYYGGWCTEAKKKYGSPAILKPGTEAGDACAAEAIHNHALTVHRYAQQIAAAMGEPVAPLDSWLDGDWWQWLLVAGLVAGVGYVGYRVYQRPEVKREVQKLIGPKKKKPARTLNPSLASWRNMRKGVCGRERKTRRLVAAEIATEARRELGRSSGVRQELRAEADRPCREADAELRRSAAQERKDREQRARKRSPAQLRAARRALDLHREKVESEAFNVRDATGSDAAGDYFAAHSAGYFREAKKGKAAPYELFAEEWDRNEGGFRTEVASWARARGKRGAETEEERLDREQREHWESERDDDDQDDDDEDDDQDDDDQDDDE